MLNGTATLSSSLLRRTSKGQENAATEDLDGVIVDLQVEEDISQELAERTMIWKIFSAKTLNKGLVKSIIKKHGVTYHA